MSLNFTSRNIIQGDIRNIETARFESMEDVIVTVRNCGKVMFSQASVCPRGGGGVRGQRGRVCVVKGACMVKGGMHGKGGHA